ncbi:hypothetical protein [Nocardia sp. XZ_19_231]|uniref:hypothetical protein n=1 Tax=Nocardia sp. XZ_19_231 TaxID=2769252 RepID=UPI0018906D76|nr:hypothetical protein [Nocardia sp. XZ_19_231]
MADKNVEFDSGLFFKAADATGRVHDRINAVLDALAASTSSREGCWGSDTLGANFFAGPDGDNGYDSSRENTVGNAGSMSTGMNNLSTGQYESAVLLRKMEQGNRDGLRG